MKFELHSKFKPTGDQPQAIAELVEPGMLCAEYIIPSALDPRVAKHVAERVAEAAVKSGAVRK